jgi:TPR repeat protein
MMTRLSKFTGFLLEGKGVARNTDQAKVWFQRAADQGNAEAAAELRRLATAPASPQTNSPPKAE